MAKSEGNFITIRDLLAHWPGDVLRFQMLMTHYRQPIDWTRSATQQAAMTLDAFHQLTTTVRAENGRPSRDMLEALADDLNTPRALAELHKLANEARKDDFQAASDLAASCAFLGVNLGAVNLQEILKRQRGDIDEISIEKLIGARNEARKVRNFKEADRIRDRLKDMGVELEDKPNGTTIWRMRQ